MFTGIIEAKGSLRKIQAHGRDLSLFIDAPGLDFSDVKLGDSIAVNGVCLTVVTMSSSGFMADVSAESLANTRIAHFKPGDPLNLEKALTLSTRLGGHLVSGHVDGVGKISAITRDARSWRMQVSMPTPLSRYVAEKGSIAVDGVSLTVTELLPDGFGLNIVPHTMANTILPDYKVGSGVHLEVDVLARYAERILRSPAGNQSEKTELDKAFLAANGFKA